MVKDLMGSKLGGGVEKERTIVAGDLVRVDKMVILHHLFVESKHVLPTYFEDFIEKRIDHFDGKHKEQIIAKIDAPEEETPGNEP